MHVILCLLVLVHTSSVFKATAGMFACQVRMLHRNHYVSLAYQLHDAKVKAWKNMSVPP